MGHLHRRLGVFLISLNMALSIVHVNNDEFRGYMNGVYQTMKDENGAQWDFPVSLKQLELLVNDKYQHTTFRTCSKIPAAAINKTKDGVTFHEMAKEAGFTHVHREFGPVKPHCQFDEVINGPYNYTAKFEGQGCTIEQMTGGMAAADYDNDGNIDVFFTVFFKPSVLYRNNGDGTFTDVTRYVNLGPSLYGNGAGWIDVDSDGDLDLFVSTVGDVRHYLYINRDGKFTEEAVERGISLKSSRKLAGFTPVFGDFDMDGCIDIFTTEWIMNSQAGSKVSATRLFRNLGSKKPGYFEDVTETAGVSMDNAWSDLRNTHNDGTHVFGGSFTDFDNDGWPELFVTGDFGRSKLFWNNKNGTFTECTRDCGIDGNENAMGLTIADLNMDGHMDIFVGGTHYDNTTCSLYSCRLHDTGNGLYLKEPNGRKFVDVTDVYGVRDTHWTWGTSFIDYDNDGRLDLVATNGFNEKTFVLDDMVLFKNQGVNKTMTDVAMSTGMNYNGMGRGLLTFDFDNDGDMDVLVAGNVGSPKLFRNDGGNNNNWIKIKPMHRCDNNANALCESYGAVVTVTVAGEKQSAQVGTKSHFLGQSELAIQFGVGNAKSVDQVETYWPRLNKRVQMINIEVNRIFQVVLPEGVDPVQYIVTVGKCPELLIKEISKQPTNGHVYINANRKSVRYDTGSYSIVDVGTQYFKYTVEISPPSPRNQSVYEAEVTLDFRGKPMIFTPVCNAMDANIPKTTKRRVDGIWNNQKNMLWGAVGENLINLAPHAYADNVSEPASACTRHHKVTNTCPYPMEFSGVGSTRPSPRLISNRLMIQKHDVFSKRNMSDFTMHFGQFFSHDNDHSTPLPRKDFMQFHQNQIWMPITIPKGDVHFDPYNTGKEKMPFIRTTFSGCSGEYKEGKTYRKQFNVITSIIDASTVYGVNQQRMNHLREFKNGRMRMGRNLMLPKNEAFMEMANPVGRPMNELYIAGDNRANVQPGLAAVHTLFVREHNRLAHEYVLKNPTATDEETFQHARRFLIAEMQAIAYREYLPALLGGYHIPKYTGYKPNVPTTISNEFATAAFRFGHSQINTLLYRLDENGTQTKYGHALLREMYFKPNRLELEGGIDPILRGSVAFPAQEIDLLMVDEIRNTLFRQSAASPDKETGFDLAAFNIQRGRDHGLSDYNTVRKKLGLKAYTSFDEITADKKVVEELEELYKDINNIDLWIGGLAEDHVHNSELGETFHKIVVEQFTRIRDGDRFWYENIMTSDEIKQVEETTLSQIIQYNTGFDDCPENVFFSSQNCIGVRNFQCIPKRSSKLNFKHEYNEIKKENEKMEDITHTLVIVAALLGAVTLLMFLTVVVLICKKNGGKMATSKQREVEKSSNPVQFAYVMKTNDLGVTNDAAEA